MKADSRVADLRITLGGRDLTSVHYNDLISVEVQDDVEAPSMATLQLLTWDAAKNQFSWVDDTFFSPGGEISIALGYVGEKLVPVFDGEITGLELELAAGESPTLVVRAYDRRHRLLRGTRTRSFVKLKDSEIAGQIAQDHGLSSQVVDSNVVHDHVLQHSQADLDFLKQRAEAIAYEVVIEGKTLHYRPRGAKNRPVLTLTTDKDLIEFHPRLSTRGQTGAVEVLGWDPSQKKGIVGKAMTGQESSMGKTPGPKAADNAFGAAMATLVQRPVFTQEEADRIALGQLENMALGYITGDGTCFGRGEIRAGSTLEITGIGKRFSGSYYVGQATHKYSPKDSYRTSVSVRRNAT